AKRVWLPDEMASVHRPLSEGRPVRVPICFPNSPRGQVPLGAPSIRSGRLLLFGDQRLPRPMATRTLHRLDKGPVRHGVFQSVMTPFATTTSISRIRTAKGYDAIQFA